MRYRQYQQKIADYKESLSTWQKEHETYQHQKASYEDLKKKKEVELSAQQQEEVMVVDKPEDVQITRVVDEVIDVDHMKEQEEEVVEQKAPPVVGEVIHELTYKTSFKLKSMKLLQLVQG